MTHRQGRREHDDEFVHTAEEMQCAITEIANLQQERIKKDCRTCMNINAYQSACNSIQRCQGETCLDGDLYEKKLPLELWEKSMGVMK